jgi:uncharacterized membrane protein (Fun14 family)
MREIMYDQSSVLIVAVLFVSLALAVEVGYRIGRRVQGRASEASRSHVSAVQASPLGVLALMLGFTFSQALQRFDSRSEAVVDEANAIGTAYLRAQLLPASVRSQVKALLQTYLDTRVRASVIPLSDQAAREAELAETGQQQAALWRYASQAAEEDPNPVTTGLFIQSLNEMIDSYGRRIAALDRHVPEVVLFLLFGTFALTLGIVGYAAGIAGHRVSNVAYIMIALIVLLVFVIIDLDRPRRGLIQVSQASLTELRTSIQAQKQGDSR